MSILGDMHTQYFMITRIWSVMLTEALQCPAKNIFHLSYVSSCQLLMNLKLLERRFFR